MTGTISGDRERMARAAKAMGQARTALNGFAAEASSIHVPAEPAALRGRIDHALSDAARTARQSEQQLDRLQRDLVRRNFLFALADALGSGAVLHGAATAGPAPGSGKVTANGLWTFDGSDEFGAGLGGLGESLERYSKIWRRSVHQTTILEREISHAISMTSHGGGIHIRWATQELTRLRVVTEIRGSALKWAKEAKGASKVLGVLGQADEAITVINTASKLIHGDPHKTAAVGGAIGGIAGGRAGTLVGAEIGAELGSVGGPLGIAVGAGIGAATGAFLGSKYGKQFGEDIGEGASKVADGIGKGASAATGAAKDAFNGAKNALGKLF